MLVLVDLIVLGIVILLGLFGATQVLIPLVRGSSLFPILRKDAQQVAHELELAKHKTALRSMEIDLAYEKAKAKKLETEAAKVNKDTEEPVSTEPSTK